MNMLTFPEYQRVNVLLEQLKDGTLACKMLHTGTHYHTEHQDPLVSASRLEEYGKEKKCLDIWVNKGKQPRT